MATCQHVNDSDRRDINGKTTNSVDTVAVLKQKLKALGAKQGGNKSELQERLHLWETQKLDRQLFETVLVESKSSVAFPVEGYEPLNTFQKKDFKDFGLEEIDNWFSERSAGAGQSKGRKLCLNKFVKNAIVSMEGDNTYFVKCFCAAQTKTAVDYRVQLQLQLGYEPAIVQASCECPAGQGKSAACKHVSAAAHLIEHFAITGDTLESVSVTSKLQVWHKPPSGRKLEKVSIEEMLGLPVYTPPLLGTKKIERTDEMVNRLVNARCPTAIMGNRTVDIHGYLHDHGSYLTSSLAVLELDRVNVVTLADIQAHEISTRQQSLSKLWKELRQTRITASMAYDIVRTVRSGNYTTGPAERQIYPQGKLTAKPIVWGVKNEHVALKEYSTIVGEAVNKCGMFIDHTVNYLAASPDGINNDKTLLVEVKCPYTVRFESPLSANYLMGGSLNIKHKYYMQVQLQMHVTKIHRCDFVVWTTKGLFIEHIKYNVSYVKRALVDIDTYYKKVFAPLCVKYRWSK